MNSWFSAQGARQPLFAALFGCCFPAMAIAFDFFRLGWAFSWENLWRLHLEIPAHFVIDSAPLVLAAVVRLVSLKQTQIDRLNSRLVKELGISNQAKERMEKELAMAHRMQQSMVPVDFILNERLRLHARLIPAKEVGGDFYDFYCLGNERLCLVVGDVSDKGVSAALFMAMSKTLLKSLLLQENDDLGRLFKNYNEELSKNNPNYMFVSVLVVIVDVKNRTIDYLNAGHCPPLLRKADGGVVKLADRHGPVAGAMEGLEYAPASRLHYAPGDTLLLYTDGITEAQNDRQALFGEQGLISLLENCQECTPEGLIQSIIDSVHLHEQGAPAADDTTVLCTVLDPVLADETPTDGY